MEFRTLDLPDVVEVQPRKFGDDRGYFSEVFRLDQFRNEVVDVDFVQENQSLSVKTGTIRGLHFQTAPFAQGKLVRCLSGAIFDVAVDLRRSSPTRSSPSGGTTSSSPRWRWPARASGPKAWPSTQ